MIVKYNQVFNLMDTNGRRNDVINAIQGYISILEEVTVKKKRTWGNLPNSLAQFEFYQKAIEQFPDVFRRHGPYDNLMREIEQYPELKKAIENDEIEKVYFNSEEYAELFKKFDTGIEDRARHYTSNLVKLGFSDSNRNISETGELLLNIDKLKKDQIEKILPIDNINIIYLRQLLKLRIFDTNGQVYYSPFNLALYMLTKNDRISEDVFLEIIQGLNPYNEIKDLDLLINSYEIGDVVNNLEIDIPLILKNENLIEKNEFANLFKNQKSQTKIETYWQYYNLIYEFNKKRDTESFEALLHYFESEKEVIKKAFCKGKNIFSNRREVINNQNDFIEKNKEIFDGNINENLYREFIKSKQLDAIHEYSDTTKRIFKATGIISFDNGYVELEYKELLNHIFKDEYIKNKIFGNIEEELSQYFEVYDEYEIGTESYYCKSFSICEIFEIYGKEIDDIIIKIRSEFEGKDIDEIPKIIQDKRRLEFENYIKANYPKEKIKEILGLFKDRTNDSVIKASVSTEATVPTIYEYIVGIAWYYFSGEKINLLNSFNLTLSADFEPLIHAGGGQGDIVIYEEDKVIMLEATLMNENSQKRGEWEPVLRHSINLKIEEELNGQNRKVTSFFIAENFDYNTINIWKAIASVPLESSIYRDRFTDNVVIMPINNDELASLMDKSDEYDDIVDKVRGLFEIDNPDFDMEWRNKFIRKIL